MRRLRFLAEALLASASAVMAILTLAVHNWIETAFGVDPDAGSGMTETGITIVLFLLFVALTADAFRLRRLARAGS